MSEQSVDKAVDKPVDTPVDEAVDEAARLAAQKKRNMWLGLALFGFVILIALISALRLVENIQRVSGGAS